MCSEQRCPEVGFMFFFLVHICIYYLSAYSLEIIYSFLKILYVRIYLDVFLCVCIVHVYGHVLLSSLSLSIFAKDPCLRRAVRAL